jgi:hypothetical protein
MRIAERIGLWLSPRRRLLNQLAAVAAQAETLAANLVRHARLCDFPTLKAGLEKLAGAETAQTNALRELLLENRFWPRLPARRFREGSSNWERLHQDLALQVEILRALQSQVPEWTGIDPRIAEHLYNLAVEEDRQIGRLRDLTLKCDPQALN